jgi:hypothetical protein
MPSFQRLFDSTTVRLESERLITLPDRYVSTPPPTRAPRYENAAMWLMELRGASGGNPFDVRWPAAGAARRVDIEATDATALGMSEWIEFAPLPFTIAATLRALPGGAPTFYFGMTVPALEEHTLLLPSDPPQSVTQLWLGVMFQDRLARANWAWIDAIGDALAAASPADEAGWRSMAALFAGVRAVHVLDGRGRPARNAPFDVMFVDAGGNVIETRQVTTDGDGRLGSAALPPVGTGLQLAARARAQP